MENNFEIKNSINVKNTEGLACTLNNIADIIFKESQVFYLPLNQRNVIVLEPEKSLAGSYINLFGSGKSYNNSSSFSEECINGKVLEGLTKDNPLVLITSVALPVDPSGKYTKFGYDRNEGVTVASHIRQGVCNIPRDIPILFYARHNVTASKKEIEQLSGVVGFIPRPLSMNPVENGISQKLFSSANKMFKNKYGNLFNSSVAFNEVYKMHNK